MLAITTGRFTGRRVSVTLLPLFRYDTAGFYQAFHVSMTLLASTCIHDLWKVARLTLAFQILVDYVQF